MNRRSRHCVECPKCGTRYLVACSPYSNGSYLEPSAPYLPEEYILYCACARPAVQSRWRCSELNSYSVSQSAYERGYGTAEEILLKPPRMRSRSRSKSKDDNLGEAC